MNSQPLTDLQIRFIEIIQLDLDALLKHSGDKPYVKHNTALLRGFVNGIALAYADQGFTTFNNLLIMLQDRIFQLVRLNIGESDHQHCLADMANNVRNYQNRYQLTPAHIEVAA